MKAPIVTLFVLSVLPIIWSWVSGYCRQKQFGAIDNKHPREQNAQLNGAGARAVAAQQNAWEALAVYAAALLAVVATGVPVASYATLTLVLLACRVAHGIFYIANWDILRSLTFLPAYGICIYMFILAL